MLTKDGTIYDGQYVKQTDTRGIRPLIEIKLCKQIGSVASASSTISSKNSGSSIPAKTTIMLKKRPEIGTEVVFGVNRLDPKAWESNLKWYVVSLPDQNGFVKLMSQDIVAFHNYSNNMVYFSEGAYTFDWEKSAIRNWLHIQFVKCFSFGFKRHQAVNKSGSKLGGSMKNIV